MALVCKVCRKCGFMFKGFPERKRCRDCIVAERKAAKKQREEANKMFLPIPSLNYKYEIDERGRARNAKTKRNLKPLKRTKGGRRYRLRFEGKDVERTIAQLLFEVHGKNPPKSLLPPIPVTVIKDAVRKAFPSLTSAAKFLAEKTKYEWHGIRKYMVKRSEQIYGWQVLYHVPEKKIFRKVDAILELRRFHREKKYRAKIVPQNK